MPQIVQTVADDTLFFRDWPQRIRFTISYENYRKFGAESTLSYGDASAPPPAPSTQPTH